jgi:polysaccharide export outer membrane protein
MVRVHSAAATRLIERAVIAVACCAAAGCAAKNADMLHFLQEHQHEVSAIEYRVGIPDTIAISAPRVLEIDGDTRRIQPDGKINLKLLGEIKVVGMTAKEIAAKLELLLGKYYLDPKVGVRVAHYASKKYYLFGQFGSPGPRPYTGRDTVVDAVLSGGVNFTSWTSRASVIRPARGEVPLRTIRVNVDRMLKKGDWAQNVLLEPDDVVYVPPTPLAWCGLKLRELLFPVAPAIEAYDAPSEFMTTSDYYEDRDGSSGSR